MGNYVRVSRRPPGPGLPAEYTAYLPDRIEDMRPLSERTASACRSVERAVRAATALPFPHVATEAVAELLLLAEAVATSAIEHYAVGCAELVEFMAVRPSLLHAGAEPDPHGQAQVTLDAAGALRDLLDTHGQAVTLPDLCASDAAFARGSRASELCGRVREVPAYIGGRSLADADYVAPPPDALGGYLDDLLNYVNATPPQDNPIAHAGIAQLQLVLVHPFADGNGRMSRALAQRILAADGLTGGLCLPFSCYVADCMPSYLHAITLAHAGAQPDDPNEFVYFFAAACWHGARRVWRLAYAIERALDDWWAAVPASDPDAGRVAGLFARMPVMTGDLLSSRLGHDATGTLAALEATGLVSRSRSRFADVDVYTAPAVLQALEDMRRPKGFPFQVGWS